MSSSSYSLVIGCVGKPSAGKSSFLNAATDANAKVGMSQMHKHHNHNHQGKQVNPAGLSATTLFHSIITA